MGQRRLLAVLGALVFPVALAAQQAPTPVITANARLVILDVVVTDQNGKTVENLTEKDFKVFEDDKPQRIRSVEPPSAHALPASSAAANTVFDPAKPASFGLSPVNILVLDQLNTHFADSSYARREMHDYLAKQPALLRQPTTLLNVFDEHFQLLQPFTRDRDVLLKALAAASTHYAWKLETDGKTESGPLLRLDQSLHALEEMAENYARIPGRKNLIWVGTGAPSIDPDALVGKDLDDVQRALRHVTNVLLDTRMVVYAVDPKSLLPGMTEVIDPSQMAFVQAAGDGLAGGTDPWGATEDFDRLGPLTGGRIIRGKNDIAEQIADSIDSGTNFYTIAYTPSSDSDAKAGYRKIRVDCILPGFKLATRNGYFFGAAKPDELVTNATYDLTTAAESPIPLNALRVTVEPDKSAAGSWVVRVGVPNLTWKSNDEGGSSANVYVMAASLNKKNKLLGQTVHPMVANAKAGTNLGDESKTAAFEFQAQPSPQAATLRFVVRDSASGRMGSFDLPLGN